jgi:hypothetical protein
MSSLDYCNALIHGLPDTMISKLQHVQNMANQICGVQKLISGTGEVQATAVNQLLEDWGYNI